MQGRLALARHQPAEAITIFQEVIQRQPTLAPGITTWAWRTLQNGSPSWAATP